MNKNIIIVVVLVIATSLFFVFPTTVQKRKKLVDWINSTSDSQDSKARATRTFELMSKSEINSTYKYVFSYALNNKKEVPDSLRYEMDVISKKYGIFT